MTGRYKTYQEYADSQVDWIGRIPNHWGVKRLKFIFDIKKRIAGQLGFDVLSITQKGIIVKDIESGDGQLSMDYSKYQLVFNGDFAMNHMDLLTGYVDISDFNGVTSPDYRVFTIKDKTQFFDRYSLYLLQMCYKQKIFFPLGQGSAHLGRWRLPTEAFNEVEYPHPDYLEQQKIANFLDHETVKIDTLITKQEKLIELLKEKRQAVISHAVTKGLNPDAPMKDSGVEWLGEVPEHWDVIFIKHLSQVKRGASPRPIDDPKYFDDNGEYAWTRIADVSSSGMYLTETTQRLSTLGSSLSVRLEAGELFLSIAGTVGKPCITTSKACIHDGFVYFPQLRINNKYLYYIFDAGQAYLGLGKMGTQLNLNTDTVGGIKIGLPPANEIEEIISNIEQKNTQYSDLISKAVSSIDLMKERKTALISAAVTGKIDVRDWQPQGV
ncbi:restriction endonuclease subunit S [Vibrio brasiliensis]|uniref:restriction endonuclease subunit S n=1 Tax=Vibrio brasiliensis TaxID=170652 RepID=UPI001EFEADD3|nr:restriction endonuclease subunit S [Vibrio brasiliensis]MCG9727862.1 restriction endonuclease subunit S [Vibrio brasiliensis]